MSEPLQSELFKLAEQLVAEKSERQRLESELVCLKRRHLSILDGVNEVVFQTDLNGNWTFLNSAWSDFLEHSIHACLGRPITDHVHVADQARVRALIDGIVGGDTEMGRMELRIFTASGEERWFELLARLTVESDGTGGGGVTGTLSDISARKRAETELEQLHRTRLAASREAGMAEVATGVLHNVGNVLNSVNVSATVVADGLRNSKIASLVKAVGLIREHKEHLGEFFGSDPKGKQLASFLDGLAEQMVREQAALSKEMSGLQQNIDHIKQIVAMQQSYAKVSGTLEVMPPHEMVEDALRMSSAALLRHRIEVVRQFEPVPAVLVDRHKVLQILVNLLSNAKQAMDGRPEGRQLVLRVGRAAGNRVRVEVSDNGAGIALENRTRIFQHGFTTKKDGHGFGLHSGANAAKQMGGDFTAHSDGPGTGATFILELPLSSPAADRRSSGLAA